VSEWTVLLPVLVTWQLDVIENGADRRAPPRYLDPDGKQKARKVDKVSSECYYSLLLLLLLLVVVVVVVVVVELELWQGGQSVSSTVPDDVHPLQRCLLDPVSIGSCTRSRSTASPAYSHDRHQQQTTAYWRIATLCGEALGSTVSYDSPRLTAGGVLGSPHFTSWEGWAVSSPTGVCLKLNPSRQELWCVLCFGDLFCCGKSCLHCARVYRIFTVIIFLRYFVCVAALGALRSSMHRFIEPFEPSRGVSTSLTSNERAAQCNGSTTHSLSVA